MAHEPGAAMGADSARGSGGGAAGRAGGRLVVVGTGIRSIAQLTQEAMAWIRAADIVCYALADPVTERWVIDNARASEDLALFYDEATTRLTTYAAMAARMAGHAQSGLTVVGVFYGHPGIFAWSPHKAIEQARAEGYEAHMEPGISAEDCLYADLGFDPGRYGCQHFEASQLLYCERRLDPAGYLVLWQLGVIGNRSVGRFDTGLAYRALLVERLEQDYPPDHEVIVYRGATLPIESPRIRRITLRELATVPLTAEDTVVLPPAVALQPNRAMVERLQALDAAARVAAG